MVSLTPQRSNLQPAVTFLLEAPPIDGRLDKQKSSLPRRSFQHVLKSDPNNPAVSASYRLAYGTHFLYIFLEIEKAHVTYRDRGYQNGDGMLLTLATPKAGGEQADEYAMFGFWPRQDVPEGVGKLLWGANGKWLMRFLDQHTQFVVIEADGCIHFELLLPWFEAIPYHPWLSPAIGFDLAYTEAVGETEYNYHMLALDDFSKVRPDRVIYLPIEFEPPVITSGSQSYLISQRHLYAGDSLEVDLATLAYSPMTESISFQYTSGEGDGLDRREQQFKCNPGLTVHQTSLDTSRLIPGGYQLNWQSKINISKGQFGFSLFPEFNYESLSQWIARLEGKVPRGTLNTVQFQLDNIAGELNHLNRYETGTRQRIEMVTLMEQLSRLEQGHDFLAGTIGFLRRAFRSDLDGTLQPYTIRIPRQYKPDQKYPLLVFLHGSDRDDTELPNYRFLNNLENWIILMPFGRGTSNAYTVDNAQQDIQEAIQDVCQNYPILSDRIVLGGFSMGGYGVYRTHYETPGRYRGLAVFSGLPSLGEKSHYTHGQPQPDFLSEEYLLPFKDVEIFISHGSRDRNTPIELTQRLVEMLSRVGAQVEFHLVEGGGHAEPDFTTIQAFYNWLEIISN